MTNINGEILRKMIICGANGLTRHSRELDALNVFPVPDGDTGVNMAHTVQAAAREASKIHDSGVYQVAKAASGGALRGARGNSGVILSQLFRGFAKGLEGVETANAAHLAGALAEAAHMAYRAVMKPKEGTILTIARALGDAAADCTKAEKDIAACLAQVLQQAQAVLDDTPNMLPELKRAGVVDSGGKGLLYFMEGALEGLAFAGEPVLATQAQGDEAALTPAEALAGRRADSDTDIPFVYCTELLIEADEAKAAAEADPLQKFLSQLGDSVVVVGDEGFIKIHVHTNHPGRVLERALEVGSLTHIKIDNMREQHTQQQAATSVSARPEKEVGFVAVAAGAGMCALFADLGADAVVEGGQTMNPSAEDIAQAVEGVHARQVLVLPNNKNIILAAQQAADLLLPGKTLHVVPTCFVPQGVACLLDYVDTAPLEETLASMERRIQAVRTGQVTYAVRDTEVDGQPVQAGDILGLCEGKIVLVGKDLQAAAMALAEHMLAQGGDFASVYFGEGVTEAMAQALSAHIEAQQPDIETEIYPGEQPVYHYIIAVQ